LVLKQALGKRAFGSFSPLNLRPLDKPLDKRGLSLKTDAIRRVLKQPHVLKHFHRRGAAGRSAKRRCVFHHILLEPDKQPISPNPVFRQQQPDKALFVYPIALFSFIRVRRRDCLSRFFRRARDSAPVMAS
jgi:hypothetical protein